MKSKLIAAGIMFLLPLSVAWGQGCQRVIQNGLVNPNDPAKFIGNCLIGSALGSGNGVYPPAGLTSSQGFGEIDILNSQYGINLFSGPNSGSFQAFQLGFVNGVPTISVNALGGGSSALNVVINGTTYPFPGAGSGNVVGPTPSASSGNVAIWAGGETLKGTGNVGIAPSSASGDSITSYSLIFNYFDSSGNPQTTSLTASAAGVLDLTNSVGASELIAGALSITDNAAVGGTLGVTGNTSLGGTLGVTGLLTTTAGLTVGTNLNVGGTLAVTGTSNFVGNANFASEITGSPVSIVGNTNVTGLLTVSTTFDVTSNATVGGALAVAGNTTLGGNVNVAGNITGNPVNIDSNLDVTGALALTGNEAITGNETISGTLGVTGAVTFSGAATVDGLLTAAANMTVDEALTTNTLSSVSNATVGGTLGVTGAATFSGGVAGNPNFSGSPTVSGSLTVASLAVTGNGTVGGTLGISGTLTATTIGGSPSFSGSPSILGTLGLAASTWSDTQACSPGQISVDSGYIYVCVSPGNTVKRVALASF